MSNSLADEIKKQAIQELDKIANSAVDIMKGFCPQGGKPWSTGKLKASIHKEADSEYSRLVGTDVEYAWYVDMGRGPVKPQNFYFHGEDKPRLYLKGYDVWLRPGQSVKSAKAQHFVEKTIKTLEG